VTVLATCVAMAAGIGAAVLTAWVRRYVARRKMLDIPNERSSHTLPTPRGGGLSIVATFDAALAALAFGGVLEPGIAAILLICGGIVAVAGLLDDRHSLPARARFATHLAAAGLFVLWAAHSDAPWLETVGFGYRWLGGLCALLALTWSTNLFNFMDGIDGIAGSEAAFAAAAGAWIISQHGEPGLSAAMWCLCAASAGFLVWNWPPARIFMGDVGSGFLGLMIPMLGLAASARAPIPLQVWIILGGLFLMDATATLFRRIIRGDRWTEPHRLHAYQQLARRWNGHLGVTVLFSAINLFWLLPWAWYADKTPAAASLVLVTALAPVLAFVLIAGAGNPERPA
jgi:Fuc2NAc and GlcNAc transferase